MQIVILIKERRKERNLTLKQLSQRTNISTTHINDIENNIKSPSLFVMVKLSKALDIPIDKLYKVKW